MVEIIRPDSPLTLENVHQPLSFGASFLNTQIEILVLADAINGLLYCDGIELW